MRRQPSTQQISWFLDHDRNGQLDLNPPYQRKSVWAPRDRRFFLDTIFRNYPTPPIFIHRTINDQGVSTFHVVDGKQRLETILLFAKNELAIDKNYGDVNYSGRKFSQLGTEEKRKFWDYTLVVDFLESVDGANIDQVFDRVNRNSKNLQDQELRHARFNGWFITEAETENEDDFWWRVKVNTNAKEKRMRNVQLIAELLLVILDNTIVGFSQDYLDDRFAFYDAPDEIADFDEEGYRNKKARVKSLLHEMESYNEAISKYAKTANNLYPLWALLTFLDDRISGTQLAERYEALMQEVEDIAASSNRENPELDEISGFSFPAVTYFRNSKGASTDLAQRENRLAALRLAMLQQ